MCGTQASSPNNFSSLFSCSIVFGNFWFQQNPSVWARRSLLVIPILWLISWQLTLLGKCTDLSKLFLPLQIGGKRGVTSQPYSVVKSFLTSVRVRQLGFGSEFPGMQTETPTTPSNPMSLKLEGAPKALDDAWWNADSGFTGLGKLLWFTVSQKLQGHMAATGLGQTQNGGPLLTEPGREDHLG